MLRLFVAAISFAIAVSSCKKTDSNLQSDLVSNSENDFKISEFEVSALLDHYNELAASPASKERMDTFARESLKLANAAARRGDFEEANNQIHNVEYYIFKLSSYTYPIMTYITQFKDLGFYDQDKADKLINARRYFYGGLENVRSEADIRSKGRRYVMGFFLFENFFKLQRLRYFFKETNLNEERILAAIKVVEDELFRVVSKSNARRVYNWGDQRNTVRKIEGALKMVSGENKLLEGRQNDYTVMLYKHRLEAFNRNFDTKNVLGIKKEDVAKEVAKLRQETEKEKIDIELLSSNIFAKSNPGFYSDIQYNQIVKYQTALGFFKNKCRSCNQSDLQRMADLLKDLTAKDHSQNFERYSKEINQIVIKAVNAHAGRDDDPVTLAEIAPDRLVNKNIQSLLFIRDQLGKIRTSYKKRSTTYQKYVIRDGDKSMKALDLLETTLNITTSKIKFDQDMRYNVAFAKHFKFHFVALSKYVIDAVMNHSHQAFGYAQTLYVAMNRATANRPNVFQGDTLKKLRELNKKYNAEQIFRVWVNADNIAKVALAALIVAEVLLALPSMGSTLAAIPHSVAALTAISITAKAVLITQSAARINDRYNFGGINGLLNFDTALDIMLIIAMLPRVPILRAPVKPTAAPVVGSFTAQARIAIANMYQYGRYLLQNAVSSANSLMVSMQYQAGNLLIWGGGGFGAYQIAFADSIAKDYKEKGVNISANQIRVRGFTNVALSLVAWQGNRNFIKRNMKSNPAGTAKFVDKLKFKNSFLAKRLKGAINPIGAARGYYNAGGGGALRFMGAAGVLAGYAVYDYVVVSEAVLISYTNVDARYLNEIQRRKPLPELRQGESALGLVGFDKEDVLLYFGSHAKHSNRRAVKAYGDRFFIEDYESPDDFISKIEAHAKKHGPIRYLKIMTHGKPGVLYSKAAVHGHAVAVESEEERKKLANDPAEQGWINGFWFEKYRERLQSISKTAFAPDARIVVFACLVGSNYESLSPEEMPEGGKENLAEYNKRLNAGDYFIDQMGKALLVNGGYIDTSTRILNGLDVSFGTGIAAAAKGGASTDTKRRMIPIVDLERPVESAPLNFEVANPQDLLAQSSIKAVSDRIFYLTHNKESGESIDIATFDSSNQVWDSAAYLGGRLKGILPALPKLIHKYGINLEGPWWETRYKAREFAPLR